MLFRSGSNYQDSIPIVQSCPSEGRRNLGAWLAPDGNNVTDLRVLCSKGKTMSTNIAASHLQREEVSIAYKMMLCSAMKYSLTCTTLSHSECDMVDRSYLPCHTLDVIVLCSSGNTSLLGKASFCKQCSPPHAVSERLQYWCS